MLFIISPAKTLDETSVLPKVETTVPALLATSKKLASVLKKFSPEDLAELMGVSEKIAELNYTRFKQFHTPFTPENARPALLTFKGDVYRPLDVAHYKKADWAYVQKHLCILSGLYGLLKPLDLMQPYRLEMGTPLKTQKGRDLYAFWGSAISEQINKAFAASGSNTLVNLASEEYFKAVDVAALKGEVLHIVFKQQKGKSVKTIGIYAKRARGLMVEYARQHKLSKPEQLKAFNVEGYEFQSNASDANHFVFVKKL